MDYLRDLENYKQQHRARVEKMGKLAQFMACRTLTEARKIAFGEKQKTPNCSTCRGKVWQCVCKGGK